LLVYVLDNTKNLANGQRTNKKKS